MSETRANLQTLDSLAESIALATKKIASFREIYKILSDGIETNALQVLLHLDCYIEFIKAEKNYVPTEEFAIVVDTIQRLPSNHFLLPELTAYLIDISDILLSEHTYNKNHKDETILEMISAVISKFPYPLFVSSPNNSISSITTNFIIKKLGKSIILTPKQFVDDFKKNIDKLSQASDFDQRSYYDIFKKNPQALEIIFPNLEESSSSENIKTDEEKYSEKINALTHLFDFCIATEKTDKTFVYLIKCLQTQYPNQTEFAKICLIAYQKVCQQHTRTMRGYGIDRTLQWMTTLFSVIDERLPVGQLDELLKSIPVLPSPNHSDAKYFAFSGKAYTRGLRDISIVHGNTDLAIPDSILQEDLLHSHRLFKIMGKYHSKQLRLSNSPTLRILPVLTQMRITNYSAAIITEFESFIRLYSKINSGAIPYQQRNIILFFNKYHTTVFQLIDIMGIEAIHYLRKQLASTVLTLERTVESLPEIDSKLVRQLAEYFVKQDLSVSKHPQEIEAFKNCLIVINILREVKLKNKSRYETADVVIRSHYNACKKISEGKTPQEFLRALASMLLIKFFPDRYSQQEDKNANGINGEFSDAKINHMFSRIKPEMFSQLAAACIKMQDDEYRDVFLEFLIRDLTGDSIENFLHDTAQDNVIGRDVARHNQAIRLSLEKKGISPQTALNYDQKYRFIVMPNRTSSDSIKENNIIVLWTYLQKLKECVQTELTKQTESKSSDNIVKRLEIILKTIKSLEELINKNKFQPNISRSITDALSTNLAISLLNKVAKNGEALRVNNAPLERSFYEFLEHVVQQLKLMDNNEEKNPSAPIIKKTSSKFFSVEQWSKDKLTTFFLGDDVGCCLASTGTQFQAIVQRRLDDAMLFHVAIDQSTKRPAALAWLYLAETVDGNIVLMANFFEVNTKYAQDTHLRKSLFNGLLQFTYHYLQDNPGIKGFYINKLSYGWNSHDAKGYPIVPLKITDKLGGPCKLGSNNQDQVKTHDKYFLTSLHEQEFHQFTPSVLAAETLQNTISLQTLIQQLVNEIVGKERDIPIDKLIQKIIIRNSIELRPFFSEPLETDVDFNKLVVTALHKTVTNLADRASLSENRAFGLFQAKPSQQSVPNQAIAAEAKIELEENKARPNEKKGP